MAWLSRWNFLPKFRKCYIILLAFIWVIGLHCGVSLFHFIQASPFPLMHGVNVSSVSIVSLLSVSLLPFLFSFFSVYIRSFPFLVLLCYIKGCLFAFVSMGIWISFDSAGWLIRLLVMFSDLYCLIPLWWFWIRCTEEDTFFNWFSVSSVVTAVICIVCLDFYCISPLLMRILEI